MSVTGTRMVPYGGSVADDGQVNRAAWAALVVELLRTEAAGNQSRLAGRVGVTAKTIGRWLQQKNDVSEQSVRDVARSLGRDPMDLLVKVGYYAPAEVQHMRRSQRAEVPDAETRQPDKVADPLGADPLPGETPDEWEVRQKRIHVWSGNPLYTKEARASLEEAIERAAASMRESDARRRALKEQMRYLQDNPGA